MPEELNVSTEVEVDEPLTTPEVDDESEASESEEAETQQQPEDDTDQEGQEGQEDQEPPLEERYTELERNYQRLERKFTKVSQRLQEAESAMHVYDFIAQRPELVEQVNQLIQAYGDTAPMYGDEQFDPAAERQTMRELLSKPDFVKYEDEIAEYADDNGLPFDSAQAQKHAYLLWRGENVDRLVQEARLQTAKKAAKVQQSKAKAGLQRAGGPGKPPQPDYKKMSDDEVLSSMGLSLWTD